MQRERERVIQRERKRERGRHRGARGEEEAQWRVASGDVFTWWVPGRAWVVWVVHRRLTGVGEEEWKVSVV